MTATATWTPDMADTAHGGSNGAHLGANYQQQLQLMHTSALITLDRQRRQDEAGS